MGLPEGLRPTSPKRRVTRVNPVQSLGLFELVPPSNGATVPRPLCNVKGAQRTLDPSTFDFVHGGPELTVVSFLMHKTILSTSFTQSIGVN